MIKIVIYFLILTGFTPCFSQFDKVNLSVKPGKNEFDFSTFNFHLSKQDINSFVIPPLKYLLIFDSYTNDNKLFYFNYKNGIVPDSIFTLIKSKRSLDSDDFLVLDNDDILEVLVGIDSLDNLIIIPNANNNKSFTDDSVYVFKRSLQQTNQFEISNVEFKNIDYRIGNNSSNLKTYYKLKIEVDFDSFDKLKVISTNISFYEGVIMIDNNNFILKIQLSGTGLDFKYKYGIYYKLISPILNTAVNLVPEREIKKSSTLEKYTFTLDSVSLFGDVAYVKVKKNNKIFSETSFINNLEGFNLLNNSTFKFLNNSYYKVLDFWASWCLPCLSDHKLLMNDIFKIQAKNVLFFGVINDENDLMNSKKYLLNSNYLWKNYFIKSKKHIEYFNVKSFPTYIVLSKFNQIILRTNSYQELMNFINQLDVK